MLAQAEWVQCHLDEAKTLSAVLKVFFGLTPTASSAERNWSLQDFIFSRRRNRLEGARGSALVYVYWNLRALVDRARDEVAALQDWRTRLARTLSSFPHPDGEWQAFSNYKSSARGDFDELYGDGIDLDCDYDDCDDQGDGQVCAARR